MIGRLKGQLLEQHPPLLLLDVQGVGYEVQAPMTTFYQLPGAGETVTLYTHLAVSETAHQLYGFASRSDRDLFRTLIKVNGVGPKMAIAILSGMEAADVARCVQEDNLAALVKVPGVGKKTAERLMIELRDKLAQWQRPSGGAPTEVPVGMFTEELSAGDEAESALVALGYKPAEAARMVAAARKDAPDSSAQTLIRLALKRLGAG